MASKQFLHGISYQLIEFPCIIGNTIGLALVVITGQNIGAANKEAAFHLGILGVWIGMFLDWYIRGISFLIRF